MTSHAEFHVSWLPLLLAALVGFGLLAAATLMLAFRRNVALGLSLVTFGLGAAVFLAGLVGTRAALVPAPRVVSVGAETETDSADLIPQAAIESPLPDARRSVGLEVSAAPLPDWVKAGTVREGDRTLVVVRSEQFATPQAAVDDALTKAAAALKADFVSTTHETGNWTVDSATARRAIRRQAVGNIVREAGRSRFTVHRAYLQVERSPETRSAVEAVWRRQEQRDRTRIVGVAAGGLTALFAVIAGAFRFADRRRRHAAPAATA